jgi:aryl-alcohol dehydrogenase-like predicted oxidoreductase
MEMRTLGSEGPSISVVGFGAWEAGGEQWGSNDSQDVVIDAIRATIDSGMNWIDTAEVYGNGASERLVGKAIAGRRQDVLLFTKVAPAPEGSGLRPEEVRAAIRGSLHRLAVDHVDLYQLHWPDDTGVPVEETWGAMAGLVDDGLTRHIGVSNFDRELIERCQAIRPVASLQNEFSLLQRDDEAELLPWLARNGIGYLAYGPLAFGILTGALSADTRFPDGDWRAGGPNPDDDWESKFGPEPFRRNMERVQELRAVAERLDTTPATLALRWVVDQPGVTAAIAGSRNPRHVHANAAAGDLKPTQDVNREIEAIFSD